MRVDRANRATDARVTLRRAGEAVARAATRHSARSAFQSGGHSSDLSFAASPSAGFQSDREDAGVISFRTITLESIEEKDFLVSSI